MSDRRDRFEAQVLPHLDAAYRYARWLARSPSDADDVVQEAALRAYRSFEDVRGADAKAWLLAIVRNCHVTAFRQQQRRNQVPLPYTNDEPGAELIANTPDPESAAMSRDEQRTLQRLLTALPEEHREVLILREIEDMDYREIAAVTSVPIGTVMSRLARGARGFAGAVAQGISGRGSWTALRACACRRISMAKSTQGRRLRLNDIWRPASSAGHSSTTSPSCAVRCAPRGPVSLCPRHCARASCRRSMMTYLGPPGPPGPPGHSGWGFSAEWEALRWRPPSPFWYLRHY